MKKAGEYPDVVQTILARPLNGAGGSIPLTRGEVAMLFLDGYAGDGPDLLDIRSQGYGDDDDWDGLTTEDVLEDTGDPASRLRLDKNGNHSNSGPNDLFTGGTVTSFVGRTQAELFRCAKPVEGLYSRTVESMLKS